jgi:hypothetical protein
MAGLLIASCERDAKIDIPKQESRLVLLSFISPEDTLITATVSLSTPLYEPDPSGGSIPYVSNAQVTLSDGATTRQLSYNPNSERYELDPSLMPIIPGRFYILRAATPEGKYAEASCTVPAEGAPVPELLEQDSVYDNDAGTYKHRYRLGFNDIPGKTNYFRLGVSFSIDPFLIGPSYGTAENLLVIPEDGSALLNDQSSDGQQIRCRFNSNFSSSGPWPPNPAADSLEMHCILSDEPYYTFHTTYIRNYNTGDNPFAEPVLIYSNVKGGFGCFAAYRLSTKKVKL